MESRMAPSLRNVQAVAADQAVHAIGMPEAGVVIAQCATLLRLQRMRRRRWFLWCVCSRFCDIFWGEAKIGGFLGGADSSKKGASEKWEFVVFSRDDGPIFAVTFHRTFSIFGKGFLPSQDFSGK